MKTETPKTVYLKDYKPLSWRVGHIDLDFDIREGETLVRAKTQIVLDDQGREDLFFNGEDLDLVEIRLDGSPLSEGKDFARDEKGLTLPRPVLKEIALEITTRIHPEKNTRLEGLYKSGDTYCTQCEAEGFRRITYYPDRPDVMATFTTRIEAYGDSCAVLLGNGNRVECGPLEGGRHFAVWHDPFPKPCYLFALVAGRLNYIKDYFTTRSGRNVELYIYVRPGDEGQCAHAMESLKKSMKWDEDVYGLEYELNLFNIVAVSDFNMGAMENKSLNVFNTALVLAHQDTATDMDFLSVEAVIAHEYFHNWSGNRVTCRDWFQLSLKEGLTVFRDQEFSADMNSRAVLRIDDVTNLRRRQFPEDAGPLAHPIRPDNYMEINNFYTMTVYEKGAEVIRMMCTILGPVNYRKGTDLYFSRHDGQAVTCEDFVRCMEDASGIDLSQFRLWYEQAGTPEIDFTGEYNRKEQTYTIRLFQNLPPTPGQPVKKPMHIPIAAGLVGPDGKDFDLGDNETTTVLHLKKEKQEFVFKNIPAPPVPSVLRNFSAPVKLKTVMPDDDLVFLMVNDSDPFNRWEAGQTYALRTINRIVDDSGASPAEFIESCRRMLETALQPETDKAFMSQMLTLPDVSFIGQHRDPVDPGAIYDARRLVLLEINRRHGEILEQLYRKNRTQGLFDISPAAMGRRALRNTALRILSVERTAGDAARAWEHYNGADNMTDRVAALSVLAEIGHPQRERAFDDFLERFNEYPLVVDKWFSLQASAVRPGLIDHLNTLRTHGEFNIRNPNRARSLYASFAMNNPVCFHAADGSGYEFLTDAVIELNAINPQIAARLLGPMREWRRYTPDRQEKMKTCMERILAEKSLSPDVFEIAGKSLKN
jgi:aminopeptidase N